MVSEMEPDALRAIAPVLRVRRDVVLSRIEKHWATLYESFQLLQAARRIASLRINDPAPQGERHGVCAITRAELRQNRLHVGFDGIFPHVEKLPHTLIGASQGYQSQHVELSSGKLVLVRVTRKFERHCYRDAEFANVRAPNRVYQLAT